MRLLVSICVVSFCFLTCIKAQSLDSFFHDADEFFNTYVSDGCVDYMSLASDGHALETLVQTIQETQLPKDNNEALNEDQIVKAFYINAYNILTISGVVNHFPVHSPLDIEGFFDKITYNIAGKEMSLNYLENEILRPIYKDARLHFVLVCGAVSCPPIINKAYWPETLDHQMQAQTQKALSDPTFVRITQDKVSLSKIMDWYASDFGDTHQELLGFINQFRENPIPTDTPMSFYEYDWALNVLN